MRYRLNLDIWRSILKKITDTCNSHNIINYEITFPDPEDNTDEIAIEILFNDFLHPKVIYDIIAPMVLQNFKYECEIKTSDYHKTTKSKITIYQRDLISLGLLLEDKTSSIESDSNDIPF